MESPSREFVAEFSATWDPMEEVPHDAIDRILLDAEQVKQFPRPIEPHGVAGVEPEPRKSRTHWYEGQRHEPPMVYDHQEMGCTHHEEDTRTGESGPRKFRFMLYTE